MKKSFKLSRCTINLFLLGIIALPTFCFASNFDGFYGGIGIGGTTTTANLTTNVSVLYAIANPDDIPTAQQNDNVSTAA